jgi:sulfate permease, SulP family
MTKDALTMKSLERMVVGLTAAETDAELVGYAFMLAKHGIVTQLDFVHVVSSQHANDNPGRVDEARQAIESTVGQQQANLPVAPKITFNILVGTREDQLCAYLEEKEIGVILLGHHFTRSSGKRALARRLAMVSPASVWIVPENSPPRINKIMAPVDFSSHSADSLSMATGISQKVGLQQCDGLHVFYDPSVFRFDDQDTIKRGEEVVAFEQFMRPLNTHDIAVERLVEEGSNVARTALRIAKERGHDLIVLSTRGRSRAASVLLGSETSQLIMESHVPVLAVKHRGAKMKLFQVLTSEELWMKKNKEIHE